MRQRITKHQTELAVWIFVVAIFFVLAYRQELQSKAMRQTAYDMCTARNVNVGKTNHYYQGMIKIEEHNPFKATSPETIKQRIVLFKSAMLNHIDCEAAK